jgi:hypothetical protein
MYGRMHAWKQQRAHTLLHWCTAKGSKSGKLMMDDGPLQVLAFPPAGCGRRRLTAAGRLDVRSAPNL